MLKSALAALLVLGTASVALADDHTDQAADAMRSYGPVVRSLTTSPAALPRSAPLKSDNWMDRASQTVDGGY